MKKLLLNLLFLTCSMMPLQAQTDISNLDQNFRQTTVKGTNVQYRNALDAPFQLEGFPWYEKSKPLFRLPRSIQQKDMYGYALALANHTAGGAIRFATNSEIICVKSNLKGSDMNHMPRTGSSGFDLYEITNGTEKYIKTFQPSAQQAKGEIVFEELCKVWNNDKKMRQYILYFPLYGAFKDLEIGVSPKSEFSTPRPTKVKNPILFYGSSITQGGCASRPANSYCAMLCRAVDAPQINLGFSGNAKGEEVVAKAISKLPMSVFIYDYDYNAPTDNHLQKTHETFFNIIRKEQPNLPIIILSRCSNATESRTNIIKKTYENAKKNGDNLVWFIDGKELFADAGDNFCTVDGCHPNDLGFYMMYKRILPVLKDALSNSK